MRQGKTTSCHLSCIRYADSAWGLGEVRTLARYMLLLERRKTALAQCLEHAVPERKSEDAFQLGPGAFARLLSELCRRRSVKCLFRVGRLGKPLPAVPAAAKAFSMLARAALRRQPGGPANPPPRCKRGWHAS
jgi:hypothetical protein